MPPKAVEVLLLPANPSRAASFAGLTATQCPNPMIEMVAKCLVEYAKTGIRDPIRLKALTVQAFTQQQQQQIQGTRS
jgi:hypothetical protein